MIYGYVRYNASDNENKIQQETLLKEAGANRIFYDVGSGLDLLRPGLKELLRTAKRGDTILVTKYHKLVRGFPEQIIFMDELMKLGITIKEILGQLDTSDPEFAKSHKEQMKFFEDIEKEGKEKGWSIEIEEKV